MNASTASVAETIASTYKARRSRRTHLIDEILALDDNERNDLVGQLLTMLEDQANGKTPTLRRASDIPRPMPKEAKVTKIGPRIASKKASSPVAHMRDWVDKPRYADLARDAIVKAGHPVNAGEIFEHALSVRPKVKRGSMDTIVSRMGTNKLLHRTWVDGTWMYDLPKKKGKKSEKA